LSFRELESKIYEKRNSYIKIVGQLKMTDQQISFGDNVKILETPTTREAGVAGLSGQVYGETTPSVTGVKVIGKVENDFAISVFIEEINKEFWFSPHLLELIDHGEGTEVIIGNQRTVRQADGNWEESEITPYKK
jgi:hypothetical protein